MIDILVNFQLEIDKEDQHYIHICMYPIWLQLAALKLSLA